MINSDTITNESIFQAETIIPRHFFSESFDSVLNSIDGVLTRSERRLLSLFAFQAYQDGHIFPKQNSIAIKLRLSVRQIRRIIASLIKGGFITVDPSSLVDRHCYRSGNQYHLLNHPAYASMVKMSSEMSYEERQCTFKEKKVIKKNQSQGVSFDPYAFVDRHLKQGKHVQSIADALNAMTARIGSIRNLCAYGSKVISVQSGNYYSTDRILENEERKKDVIAPNLMEKLNFMPKKIPVKKIKSQNDLHQEIRALKGLPDRKCGVSLHPL